MGQRASAGGPLKGGVNLGSTLALGQGKAVVSRDAPQHQGGGMIVDVDSDDARAGLVAHQDGGTTQLHAGRNLIPVPAWAPGAVRLDFAGKEAPALKASPQYLDYHLMRGGVSYRRVRVMKITFCSIWLKIPLKKNALFRWQVKSLAVFTPLDF